MEVPKHFIVLDDDRSNNLICEFSVRRFSATADIKTFLDPEIALQYIRAIIMMKKTTIYRPFFF